LKQLVFFMTFRRPLGLAACADGGGGIMGLKGTVTTDEGFTG